jgi:hypothetical protein
METAGTFRLHDNDAICNRTSRGKPPEQAFQRPGHAIDEADETLTINNEQATGTIVE